MENTILQIDKSTWTPVKFTDIAFEPKEACRNIIAEGIQHVVGLEHIDSGEIHLRKSATAAESTTFTKKFKSGDVLFGRRRAYLKKAALAHFDGICSGDITVFRAKGNLLPELLPFIVNNDKFFDYAVKHSAGGLSPRVKFKDLANYEFLLPPKDEQARLAELLWAMDDVIESEKEVLKKVEIIRESLFHQFKKYNPKWVKHNLGELLSFNYGKPLKESDRIQGDNYVVTSAGVQGKHKDFMTKGPGIVVGRKGNAGQITWIEGNFWTTDTAYYITVKESFMHVPFKFFYYLLKSLHLEKLSIATAVPGLNRDDALLTKVFLPAENEIIDYLNRFQSLDEKIIQIKSKHSSSHSLQKSLINQVF